MKCRGSSAIHCKFQLNVHSLPKCIYLLLWHLVCHRIWFVSVNIDFRDRVVGWLHRAHFGGTVTLPPLPLKFSALCPLTKDLNTHRLILWVTNSAKFFRVLALYSLRPCLGWLMFGWVCCRELWRQVEAPGSSSTSPLASFSTLVKSLQFAWLSFSHI